MQTVSLRIAPRPKNKSDPRRHTKRHEREPQFEVISCAFVDRPYLLRTDDLKRGRYDNAKTVGYNFISEKENY
jgi:hypothetical protein